MTISYDDVVTMRSVPIRQFQRGMYQEIKDLPVSVTRNGEPLFVVTSPENVVTTPSQPQKEEKWQGICQAPNQRCREFGKKYSITFNDGEQDVTVEQYLCQNHYLLANSEAEDVEEV